MPTKKELKKEYQYKRSQIRLRRRALREEQRNLREKYQLDKSLLSQNPEADLPRETGGDLDAYREGLPNRREEIAWAKLDNSAIMYPIITGQEMSNVFRLTMTLNEEINPDLLQKALVTVLPKFPVFNTRLRQGLHWFYLEQNGKPAPIIAKEDEYPCAYIEASKNRSYLFRVSYFRYRINLEVFHVLADGNGAMYFLKELVYQYLRYVHPDLEKDLGNALTVGLMDSARDWFEEFYDKKPLRPYRFQRAFLLPGNMLSGDRVGILHGYMLVKDVVNLAHRYGATVNELVVAVLAYSIWQEFQRGITPERPVVICVPVNLRPVFDVDSPRNFFVNVNAIFRPELVEKEEIGFADVLAQVQKNLRGQINRESLQERLSTNVSTEKNLLSRMVPMVFKNPVLRSIYRLSEKSVTSTVTNLGVQQVDEPYRDYVRFVNVILAHAKGQPLKLSVSSYGDRIVINITSVLKSTSLARRIYAFFTQHGIEVDLATNGVYQ